MNNNTIITLLLLILGQVGYAQSYQAEDIQIGLNRGKCYQAAIHIDKSTIIDSDHRISYFGNVSKQDQQAAFEISAYPLSESPQSSNRLTVIAFARNGGHQEVSLTYQGKTSIFYPDRIKSYSNQYGYHHELGNQNGNVLEELFKKEVIKIDITEKACGNTVSNNPSVNPPPTNRPPPKPVYNPNEGCSQLHDVIVNLSNRMYKWPNEGKGKKWATSMTKKIYDLPEGCRGRDLESAKLFEVATKLYPKFHEDDKRYSWFKTMLQKSFNRPSNYNKVRLGEKIDALLQEASDIFEWNQSQKKIKWVTKKLNEMLDN